MIPCVKSSDLEFLPKENGIPVYTRGKVGMQLNQTDFMIMFLGLTI